MRNAPPKIYWGQASLIAATVAATALTLFLVAQGRTGEIVVPQEHPTAHTKDHGDQTWPPQPRGMTDSVNLSEPNLEPARRSKLRQRFTELEKRGATRQDYREALGRRFTPVDVVDEEDKSGKVRGSRFTYFSRDKNATVEVLFDGADIKSIKSIPASEYQPEITDEEIAEATELAREHFSSLGFARVQDLKGYGILAYRPEGRGFYDGRVIYVSFHANDDAPPEFMAWVDLASQSILKYRAERVKRR